MSRLTQKTSGFMRSSVTLTALCLNLLSCSAERFQPQVQGVENAEARLQLRTELASNLNDRVEQVAIAAEQLTIATNQLLNLFPNLKQAINAQALKTLSTAIASLRNGIGADQNDRFMRTAHIDLDFLSLDDPCRGVDLIVDGLIQGSQLGSEIQIRARTCATDGKYAPFIKLNALSLRSQKFSIEMKPFETILGTAIARVEIPPECEVEISESYTIDYLNCKGVQIHSTPEVSIQLEKLEIDRRTSTLPALAKAGPTFLVQASITPQKGECSTVTLWLDKENKPQNKQEQIACPGR
ncbi:MAG: hypothetical protein K2X47_02960, partial [Bdellovibrionales bacterium]|nr:hypothetical protein [Bdellovibrionales bacterium]